MTDIIEPEDQPPDEVEPHALIDEEVGRLIHHPRREAARLHDVADAGETGVTPFIEIVAVARYVVPLVLLVIGLIFGVYLAAR